MNKKIIRAFLDKHMRMDAIQYCMRHSFDNEYCKKVLEKDCMLIKCEVKGEANQEKNLYLIEYGDKDDGFFAAYRKLLSFLYYADYFQFCPIVRWTHDFLYAEKSEVNGSQNPYEYFFSQPQGISLDDMHQSKKVFRATSAHVFLAENLKDEINGYELSKEYMDNMARITSKYIKLNSVLDERFKAEMGNLFKGEKTLGVHVRGSDFKNNYNGHPVYVMIQDFIKASQVIMEQGYYKNIFLATDDLDAVREFQSCYKEKLILYQDVKRTSGNVSVAFAKEDRELHHYKLGTEVLRDMLTLASCDGLVAGKSQVSICAQITKRSKGETFESLQIMNQELNKNNKNFR